MMIFTVVFILSAQLSNLRTLDDVRDQVMYNTGVINALETRVDRVQSQMLANDQKQVQMISDLAVLRSQQEDIRSKQDDIVRLMVYVIGFVVTQLAAMVLLGVRYYMDRRLVQTSRSERTGL